MTSPTGRIVSRVGVRVLPNTATFRRSLDRFLNRVERSLRVEIPAMLNTSGLDADLRELKARIERTRPARIPVEYDRPVAPPRAVIPPVRVPVDALTAEFERKLRADVTAIARRVNAGIPLTARGEGFRQQVAARIAEIERMMRTEIPTDPVLAADFRRDLQDKVDAQARRVRARVAIGLDIDRNRLTRSLGRIVSTIAQLGTRIGSVLTTTVGAASSVLSVAGTSVGGLVAGLAKAAIVAPVAAAGIAVLGGAAVAAFGAIGAGALGLPVVLSSLLAPIAAIALGLDGIKRAAEPIKDEIQKLKDVVNIAFELNMRPVFEKLQAIFPLLNVGISESARALSRFAMDLATVVTSEAGMENLRVALAGVSDVLDRARFGATTLFTSLLNVAGTRELYDILGDTIGGVAERFGHMIERVRSSGDLAGGLTQLRDLLFSVTDMLVVLTEGAIKFFENAGPGLSSFFDSLTAVLARVDWAGLGESFGGLMERLGTALERVPPETWQRMATAVGELADRFVEWVESGGIASTIQLLAQLGGALLTLNEALSGIVSGVLAFDSILQSIQDTIYKYVTEPSINAIKALMEFLGIASPAQKLIDIGLSIVEGLLFGLAGGPAAVFAKILELGQKALDALANAPSLLVEKGRNFVDGAKRGIDERLESARAKATEIKDKVLDALSDARDWLVNVGADMVMGFIRGIGNKIADAGRAAADMAKRAYDAARAALWSSSPSRLFAELGRDTAEGYIVGLQDRYPDVDAAIARVFADIDAPIVPAPAMAGYGLGGAGLTFENIRQAMLEAVLEALTRSKFRADGEDLTLVVNRGNAHLARR